MPALEQIEQLLSANDFDAVEDAWLAQLEKDFADIQVFVTAAEALRKAGEEDRTVYLLELLDDQLKDTDRWHDHLAVLRQFGPLLITHQKKLHTEIFKTLKELYGDRESFAMMAEKVGLQRAVEDIPKTWKKADRLTTLLAFDIGSIVRMDGKGAGRVVEVNMALESFKVEFENNLVLRVGFSGAAKLLERIPASHILRRKLEAPEELLQLRDDDPSELLRLVLESFEGPRTSADIKRALAGIVPDNKWTSWWAAARKHPQVLVSSKGRHSYTWARSSDQALDSAWQSFQTADTIGRLERLRRDGERSPELKQKMARALAQEAAAVADSQPGLAGEIWFNLERAGALPGEEVSWTPTKLLIASDDPLPLFAGISDRLLRERAYGIARDARDDWSELFVRLMRQEADPRSLDLIAEALGDVNAKALDQILDAFLSQPRKAPHGFVWFAERAGDRPEWLARNPTRVLRQLLRAMTDGQFSGFKTRLMPLIESGGTMPRLLSYLDSEQGAQALVEIEKSPALVDYEREPLINALHLKFPELRTEKEAPIYALESSIRQKREELRVLAEVELPQNRRAIEEARELGDLRENFEYKSARQRHEYLSARATALNHDLIRVRPIDLSKVSGKEVIIGSRVHFLASGGKERTLVILGPWESDPEAGVLSHQSELAQKILGCKIGDEVDLQSTLFRLDRIEAYVPGD